MYTCQTVDTLIYAHITCFICLGVDRLQTRQLQRNGIEEDPFVSNLQGSPLYLHPAIDLFLLHEIFRLRFK